MIAIVTYNFLCNNVERFLSSSEGQEIFKQSTCMNLLLNTVIYTRAGYYI